MIMRTTDFLFVDKYAPQTVEECILPEEIKDTFTNYRNTNKIPNLILYGASGIGKTSVILALAKELGMDFMKINGSNEGRSIDTVRNKISSYASTISLSGSGKKILLLDEADNLTFDAQKALLGIIEETQKNCVYVFTCNYVNKLLPAIHSRTSSIQFKIPVKEKPKLAAEFFQRLIHILETEGIEYDKKVLVELIKKYFPDFRRTLHELQRYTSSGKLELNVLAAVSNSNIEQLLSHMKECNFTEVRKWSALNSNDDMSMIFRQLYDELPKVLVPNTLPSSIILLADYQFKSNFVCDQEINLVACLTEIMSECKFR
jgi:DNA polymerase III delta prime subunit